jgi:hypothetical protein
MKPIEFRTALELAAIAGLCGCASGLHSGSLVPAADGVDRRAAVVRSAGLNANGLSGNKKKPGALRRIAEPGHRVVE